MKAVLFVDYKGFEGVFHLQALKVYQSVSTPDSDSPFRGIPSSRSITPLSPEPIPLVPIRPDDTISGICKDIKQVSLGRTDLARTMIVGGTFWVRKFRLARMVDHQESKSSIWYDRGDTNVHRSSCRGYKV